MEEGRELNPSGGKLSHIERNGDTTIYTKQDDSDHVSIWKHMKLQFVSSTIISLAVIHAGLAVSFPNLLTKDFSTDTVSYYASLAALSTPLGSVVTSTLSDKIGRKYTLIVIQGLTVVTWLLVAFAYSDGIIFYSSSVFTGIARGALTSHCATYITEITHSDFRQMFLSFCTLYFTIGYCILSVFNLWLTSQEVGWCFTIVFALMAVLVAVLVPESPHWLGVVKGDARRAKNTLRKYNCNADMFEKEWKTLHCKIESKSSRNVRTGLKFITSPAVYRPSMILICLLLFQQFCGIYPISAYTLLILPQISNSLGGTYKSEIFVIIGVIRLLISIVTTLFLSKFNQKQLLNISFIGMVLTCLLIVAIKLLVPSYEHEQEEIGWSDWMLVISFILFVAVSCVAAVGVPWTIIFELLPIEVRGILGPYFVTFGYVVMSGWLKTFPDVLQSLGILNIFISLAVINIAGSLFIHYFLMETRGKSLYEIENHFAPKKPDKC